MESDNLDDDALTLLRRDHFGFVFQAFHVLPQLTVEQNVALPLLLRGIASRGKGAGRSSRRSASTGARRARRASFPAASCSASRSRARSWASRSSCWPTSRPATSTRTTRARCWGCFRTMVKERGAAAILATHSEQAAAGLRPALSPQCGGAEAASLASALPRSVTMQLSCPWPSGAKVRSACIGPAPLLRGRTRRHWAAVSRALSRVDDSAARSASATRSTRACR